MALLRTDSPQLSNHVFPLDSDQAVIGRSPDCSIVLPLQTVSGLHAEITHNRAGYVITDLNSRNGTLLNGVPLTKATLLADGDRISICGIVFQFDSEEQTRALDNSASSIESAILTDDDIDQPINVTSQIDLRSLQGPIAMPATLEESKKRILGLQHKITAISELMRNLSRGYSSRELLPRFLENVLKIFTYADFACILERDEVTGKLSVSDFNARDTVRQYRISRSVASYVLDNNSGILSENLSSDDRFETSESILQSRISSIMAVPIPDPDTQKPRWVIQVDSRTSGRRFSNSDLDLLYTIANQLAMYQRAVRLQEVQYEASQRAQEMAIAKKVQEGFLPTTLPELEGYQFYHLYQPKEEVGGDFYDYIHLSDGRLAVLVADVSGHGISGALVTAKLSSDARYYLLTQPSLPDVMTKLSASVHKHFGEAKHVTMDLVVIDPKNQRFSLLNAAHPFPFRKRGEQAEIIGEGCNGFPIGWDPEAQYEEYSFEMEPGDFLVLVTDGITEAGQTVNRDPNDVLFKDKGVLNFLRAETTDSVQRLGDDLLEVVREHERKYNEGKRADDKCIVIIKRVA